MHTHTMQLYIVLLRGMKIHFFFKSKVLLRALKMVGLKPPFPRQHMVSVAFELKTRSWPNTAKRNRVYVNYISQVKNQLSTLIKKTINFTSWNAI